MRKECRKESLVSRSKYARRMYIRTTWFHLSIKRDFARPWGSKVSLSPVLFNKWNWWKLSTTNSFSLPNNINILEYLNGCKLVPVYSHFVWRYWSSISDNKLLSYSSSLKLLSFFALKLVIWNRYSAISLQLPSLTFTWWQRWDSNPRLRRVNTSDWTFRLRNQPSFSHYVVILYRFFSCHLLFIRYPVLLSVSFWRHLSVSPIVFFPG